MTTQRSAARQNSSRLARSQLLGARLKDEVYRQMFLLEENRPGAGIGLAVALLRAWLEADSTTTKDQEREWLKKVSPICLEMIEASMRGAGAAHGCTS